MLNAGIAGMGWWGRTLVDSVQGKSGAIRFVAGTTRTLSDDARKFAGTRNIAVKRSLDEILADASVQAVVLATPHGQHADQMVAAAAAGKHIFVEKPFTLDKASAERAMAAIRKAGVKVAIGHNRRFHPAMKLLGQWIRDGRLGTLEHVEASMSVNAAPVIAASAWRADRREWPCGGLTPMGIHAIDMIVELFGPADRVFAQAVHRAATADIDDTTSVLFAMKSGATGYLSTLVATAPNFRFQVYGSAGHATISTPNFARLDFVPLAGPTETHDFSAVEFTGTTCRAELEAFAGTIAGGPAYPVTPEQMVHCSAIVEAVIASAAGGKQVQVP